jgi:hypothetical protein
VQGISRTTSEGEAHAFLARLSGRSTSEIEKAGLMGPFTVPGAPLFANSSPLLIGKVVTRLRPGGVQQGIGGTRRSKRTAK